MRHTLVRWMPRVERGVRQALAVAVATPVTGVCPPVTHGHARRQLR